MKYSVRVNCWFDVEFEAKNDKDANKKAIVAIDGIFQPIIMNDRVAECDDDIVEIVRLDNNGLKVGDNVLE